MKGRITSGRSGPLTLSLGRLQRRDRNYGLPVSCYVCSTPHVASGLARIEYERGTTNVPLCEVCLASPDDIDERLLRKFLRAPVLKVTEDGKAMRDQIEALIDKQDPTEH